MLDKKIFIFIFLLLGLPRPLFALPWDTDMYSQQSLKSNEVARAPVKGTVPRGRADFLMTAEEMEKQENPVIFNTETVLRGRRLWNSNCAVCHNVDATGGTTVGSQMGVPNITLDFYKDKPDGKAFAVIHHGQGNMPRYGYKFSIEEHWALVNYLRFLQGREVSGVERPSK